MMLAAVAVSQPVATAHALAPDRDLGDCSVTVWSVRDGMPGAWIRAITQSADGYLYVGTQGGLARYGGGPIVALPPPRAFPHGNDVMRLLVAKDGTLWVLPPRGVPLCVGNDAVDACAPSPDLPPEARTFGMSEHPAAGLWLASTAGLFRLRRDHRHGGQSDRAGDRWERWLNPQELGSVVALAHETDGTLLLAGPDGLRRLATAGATATPPSSLLSTRTLALSAAPGGHLWAMSEEGLYRIDSGRLTALAVQGLPLGKVIDIREDRDENLWVGTRAGLWRLRAGDRQPRSFGRADGLPDDDVSAIFEDREGSLWVGTRNGGLAQFTDRSLDRRAGPPSLRETWVSSVTIDGAGVLWAASVRGLTRMTGGKEETFTSRDGLPSDQITAVVAGPDGQLFVGTDRGLARMRGQRFDMVPGFTSAVTALARDGVDTIIIGSGQGLSRLVGLAATPITPHPKLGTLELGEIRAIARDDRGILHISANGRLLAVQGDHLVEPHAPLEKVRGVSRDPDGTLWFGTGFGLARLRAGKSRLYGTAEGLPHTELFQVLSDDLGHIFMGTSHGLLRVAKAALEQLDKGHRRQVDVVTFAVEDDRREVRINRTRQPGAWKDREGRLWFASGRGVISVDPRRLPGSSLVPPVVIERALVDGRPALRGVDNAFPPGSGAFEFHFAAITLIEPRLAQHRYRLEGFDSGWIDAGTRRSAYYTNMRPGSYRFRVLGRSADGVWNDVGDSVQLTLAPHLHERPAFHIALALAALALVFAVHRSRVQRLQQTFAATAAERARVARELHDSLLQGMAAAQMHLRGVRKRFAPTASPTPASKVAEELSAIEELVARNIEETRQFVWDLRDSMKPPQELGAGLVAMLDRARSRCESTMTMEQIGTPIALPADATRELLRIAHEAIANAVRHASAGEIRVTLAHEAETVTVTVRDDGRGFEPNRAAGESSGHFGVTGMRERAARIGRLTIESHAGQGTKVEIMVQRKDLRDV